MRVLLICPTLIDQSEAIDSWNSRLSPQDSLFIMNLNQLDIKQMNDSYVHPLNLNLLRFQYWHWRCVLLRAQRRYLPAVFWPVILGLFWPEFLWNIRSFDPDVIDLRFIPNSGMLRNRLHTELKHVLILSDGDTLPVAIDTSWRRYDPNVKVSIVLPVYNGAPYLRQAIESCLNQTHQCIELVIVDDCSTDETPRIIAEYARQDRRIVEIRNERNLHLPRALNVGFGLASGELLTWTSHDNYYAPNAIEMLVQYLCAWRDVDLVYSAYHIIDSQGQIDPNVNYLPPPWQLPFQNTVGAYFLYWRRVYEEIGDYREDMEYLEDYEYWVRVYKKGFKMMCLHLPLYYYRHHTESMTAQVKHMGDELWGKVRREHFGPG